MEDGLVPSTSSSSGATGKSLNPCCSGRWSRTFHLDFPLSSLTVLILVVVEDGLVRINPHDPSKSLNVLILVVVEDGLVLGANRVMRQQIWTVLILVVVEDGLVRRLSISLEKLRLS